ncbi:MAG: COG1361 S-layer family protein [Candidatus Nanoarchaeia archaeon]
MKNNKKTYGFISMGIIFLVLFMSANNVFAAEPGSEAYVSEKFLNQDPDPAEPGKYLELRWQVIKYGDDEIKNITYELEEAYPFSFDSSDSGVKVLGSWSAASAEDEYYTLYYKVKVAEDAIEGDYDIKLKATVVRNSKAVDKITEYKIRVGDKKRPELVIGSISTSPSKLVSDTEEAKLLVEVENIGNSDAYNVRADLVLPKGFTTTYSYSDSDNLGTIAAGQSKTATFYVDVDKSVKSGLYPTDLKLRFKEDLDETDYFSDSLDIDLSVLSRPIFEIVSVETSPGELVPGAAVEMKIKVKNTGGKDADSVSIKAFKESSQPFDFDEKSDFIGNLAAGETGEAIIKFTVEKDAVPKKHILDLEVRSISENNVVLDTVTVPLEVKPKTGRGSDFFSVKNIAIIVLLLGVLFLGYRLYAVSK